VDIVENSSKAWNFLYILPFWTVEQKWIKNVESFFS
jgi:hypothetical protein